jgi:zinc/manganese transport system substrate-binding protein
MTTTTPRCLAVLVAGAAVLIPRVGIARMNVVATVPDLAAIAKEIGGKQASVKTMALPSQDPHFVDARPSLVLDLNKADLVLAVGLQLEVGWLPVLLTSSRNPAIQVGSRGYLECAQFVRLLEVPTQPIERSMGDIHPGGNPHYLSDPRAAAEVAKGIAAKMAEIDPGNRAGYQTNLAAFLQRLDAVRTAAELRLAPYRGASIIGYHRTLVYLADWLKLTEVEFVEPKPGIPPSTAHIARVIAVARARQVRMLLQESYYPDVTSKFVAQKIPAPIVKLPGGTDFVGGQSYVDYVAGNVATLERALGAGRKN